MRNALNVLALCGIGLLLGCGNDPSDGLVPVSGTVTLDGDTVEGISVTLMPEFGVGGKSGYGTTDAQGQFQISSGPEMKGVVPGKYRALFQKMTQPDGSPIPPDAMEGDVEFVNQLPPIYSDMEKTPLRPEISESGENGLEFELKSNYR